MNEPQTEINATISARILALIADGFSLRAATDAVLGKGTFERIAGEIYDALNAPKQ